MKASDIILKVADKCLDTSFSDEDILALINEARGQIADDVDLPNLKTSDTVITTAETNSVELPVDYHKGLFHIASTAQRRRIGSRVSDYHNIDTLLKAYPNMDTIGQIALAVVDGSSLVYQGQANDVLTLQYYKYIVDIGENDEPAELPANMHLDLLMNYCLKEIFASVEDGLEGPKHSANWFESRFQVAMARLQNFVNRSKPREAKHLRGME